MTFNTHIKKRTFSNDPLKINTTEEYCTYLVLVYAKIKSPLILLAKHYVIFFNKNLPIIQLSKYFLVSICLLLYCTDDIWLKNCRYGERDYSFN